MQRDGASSDYRQLGGSPEHEPQWRAEYIQKNLQLAQTDLAQAMQFLSHAEAGEALPEILKLQHYSDDYDKFWYAFYLYELARTSSAPTSERKNAQQQAVNLWNLIVSKPAQVTPENRPKIQQYAIEALKVKTAEEYLVAYSHRKLAEAMEQGIIPST